MRTEIEITRVDEAAAQRLADATGKVVYLSMTEGGMYMPACLPCVRMTTDRGEAVGWGEFVAVAPQPPYWHGLPPVVEVDLPHVWPWEKVSGADPEPEPQLRVVRVLEYRGPRAWVEKALANSFVSQTEPRSGRNPEGSWEIVEQIRTTERLCGWCGGEHLRVCSEDGCSANPAVERHRRGL